VDLLHVLGDAGGVGRALQERGADVGPLAAAFDVPHEVVGHHVDVAVLEVMGEVVVAVDAGARDDPHAGFVGDALHEPHVAAAEHRRRLHDRAHPVLGRRANRHESRIELELVVVTAGPLLGDRLVAEPDVLVGEHDPQLARVHRPLHRLHLRHALSYLSRSLCTCCCAAAFSAQWWAPVGFFAELFLEELAAGVAG
jgi:hypothetical protein